MCPPLPSQRFDSVTESIPDAPRHLARTLERGAREGVALIKKKACIGEIEGCDQDRPLRPEGLARPCDRAHLPVRRRVTRLSVVTVFAFKGARGTCDVDLLSERAELRTGTAVIVPERATTGCSNV